MKNLSATIVSSIHTLRCFVALLVLLSVVSCGDPCPEEVDGDPCSCTNVPMGKLMALFAGIETAVTKSMPVQLTESPGQYNEVGEPTSLENSMNETASFSFNQESSIYTLVKCRAPKTLNVLEQFITDGLYKTRVDKFEVVSLPPQVGNTLVRFSKEWLKNIRVKQFEVRDTALAGDFLIHNNPFEGQGQSLLWLTAKNCYLSGGLTVDTRGTFVTHQLKSLPLLEGLDLSRNRLSYIYDSAFRHTPANLNTINLSYNNIDGMENEAFRHMQNLQHVDLSHNLFSKVERGHFARPARVLKHINLSWNSIHSLPEDIFNDMPSLKEVNMRSNFLFSMPEKPWNNIWKQLTMVDVTDNFVECDCSLKWLTDILSSGESARTHRPEPRPGQTVLGFCSQTQLELFTKERLLETLSRSDVNC